jgi:bifunctional UDP-N-acetylglucosamine pyrophosphorylase/glucosamine-1-phosphate N-acetyltransferase
MTFRFIVLAAGKGSRMKSETPKTLLPVGGKPILQHLMESVKASGVDGVPIVVVGRERDPLCERFGEMCEYVVQEEQLGTGHAVRLCQKAVGDAGAVIVLYGDHPFFAPETLKALADLHQTSAGVMTMMTTSVPSFEGWHQSFLHWGRILRDTHGHIIGIREYKDAMESERDIREVNPALYCFDTTWLWANIHQLRNNNVKGEYYLTDLVELAVAQGHDVATLPVAPEEAIGVNTPEELRVAEEVLKKRAS